VVEAAVAAKAKVAIKRKVLHRIKPKVAVVAEAQLRLVNPVRPVFPGMCPSSR